MNYLTLEEVISLQSMIIQRTGGTPGVNQLTMIDSALQLPRQSFGGEELYPTLAEKAGAMSYSLARNHGFIDGNKRIAHAAMEAFLLLNGFEIDCNIDEQEQQFLNLAAGQISREEQMNWVQNHMVAKS